MKKTSVLLLFLLLALSALSGCGGANAAVDLDLVPSATLSPTVIYSLATNIAKEPADYAGKTIRAEGEIVHPTDSTTGKTYHYIIITDNTGCCQQDLELILENGDYPEEGEIVQISGVYTSYEENGKTFYYIKADALTVVEFE